MLQPFRSEVLGRYAVVDVVIRANPTWLSELLARGCDIHCGFDADEPGDTTATQMIALHPAVQRLRPPAHDWNDVLTSRRVPFFVLAREALPRFQPAGSPHHSL